MSTKYGKQAAKQSSRSPAVTKTDGPLYGPSHWPTPQASTFHQRQAAQLDTKPEASGSPPAQDEPDKNKYPCTFKGCGCRFATRWALNQHKDSEHDYCVKCDLDFEDEEALYVHRMSTAMHIICPICDKDFASEPGRDRHAKQVSYPS